MKRMILCPDCIEWWEHMIEKNPYKDEFSIIAYGQAKENYLCDSCNKHLSIGNKCCALSHWTTRQGNQYARWEMDYLTNITWRCDVCGEERADKDIKLFIRDVSSKFGLPPGHAKENIKYCGDKPECRQGAMYKTIFNNEKASDGKEEKAQDQT